MSEERFQRLFICWSDEARADLHSIDRLIALDILYCADRYLATRNGNVKKHKPPIIGLQNYSLFRMQLDTWNYRAEIGNLAPVAERPQLAKKKLRTLAIRKAKGKTGRKGTQATIRSATFHYCNFAFDCQANHRAVHSVALPP